jgi:RNA polymerase sigma factor (sigma-70 family)
MTEDSELLCQYANGRSESAFAELVRRRIDLVYSVALRQVAGDTHLAEDVTQRVFTDLARKARALSDHPALSGWLGRSAQFAAADVVRAERRRRIREQEAPLMNEVVSHPAETADWERMRPALDRALGELREKDRNAVVLRFYEARSFGEIGERLRLTEDAARKRVERALDRLRTRLNGHGITSTGAAIAALLTNQTTAAAPAYLAANVVTFSSGCVAAAGGGAGGALALIPFMSTAKITIGIIGTISLLGLGTSIYEARELRGRQFELDQALRQQITAQAKILSLQQQLRQATRAVRAVDDDNAKLLNAAAGIQPKVRITVAMARARLQHARELAKMGDRAGALKEYLWCFDEGMVGQSSLAGVRMGVLSETAKLGADYPEALAALRDRRDKALEEIQADGSDFAAIADFAALNRGLGDNSSTLALYDQLGSDAPARRRLATDAFDALLSGQRYSDAAEASPYALTARVFDTIISSMTSPNSDLEEFAASRVEALAGAGNITDAQALAKKLLAFDNSPAAKAALQAHLARAGRPDLLMPISNP